MSTIKKLTPITQKQIAAMGVQALADRPNAPGGHGQSGLSPLQLKLWFDKLVTLTAEKINEIQKTLSADDAASYIRLAWEENEIATLQDLLDAIASGKMAGALFKVFPSAVAENMQPLQEVLNSIAETLSNFDERISENYIKGEKGDTGFMFISIEDETLILESQNDVPLIEDETLIFE